MPVGSEDIAMMFAMMEHAGLRPSDTMKNAEGGMVMTLRVWSMLFHDVDGPDLLAAAVAMLASETGLRGFYPAPGLIRKYLDEPTGDDAWGAVLADVSRVGVRAFDPDRYDEPVLRAIEAVGGIDTIGRSTIDDHASMRAAFRVAWEAGKRAERAEAMRATGQRMNLIPAGPARPALEDRS